MTPNDPHPSQQLKGELLLVGLTVLWGSSFIVIKSAEQSLPPGSLLFLRFLIAALLLSPFAKRNRKLWLTGIELGLWLWAGYMAQAVGLRITTPGRCAFVTSLNVIFVPLFAVLAGRRIHPIIWLAAAMALGGAALLCYDNSPANVGDLWVLLCAALFALFIVRLESAAKKFPALPLTVAQLWTVCLLSLPWFLYDRHTSPPPIPWRGVIYLGLICTAVTTWLQTVGQRLVPAAQASIIFMLESVFASLFALIFIHDHPGWRGITGASIILAATALAQLPTLTRNPPSPISPRRAAERV